MNPKKSNRLMPLIMAVCVILGILIGMFYTSHFSGHKLSIINSNSNKLNNLLHIVNDQYVDTVQSHTYCMQRLTPLRNWHEARTTATEPHCM